MVCVGWHAGKADVSTISEAEGMKILIQVDAPMSFAQTVKEIIAMRLECVGRVKILRIDDDGYGRQETIKPIQTK